MRRLVIAAILALLPVQAVAGPSITGSFQGWNPADPAYDLQTIGDYGHYLTVTLPAGAHEYKVVETDDFSQAYPASNIAFTLAAETEVTFFANLTVNVGVVDGDETVAHQPPILAGDFIDLWGGAEWDAADATGEMTQALPAGHHECKVALNGNWDQDTGANTTLDLTGPTYVEFTFEFGETDLTYTTTTIEDGDLVVSEIMQNPDAVDDADGEWFEIVNASANELNLKGVVVKDDGTDSFTITGDLNVSAGGYILLAINGNRSTNGGLPPVDYVYSGFTLDDDSDEVVLASGADEIDRVAYDDGATFPDPTGASMYLGDVTDDNSVGSNWAEDTFFRYGLGDYGTPAASNFPRRQRDRLRFGGGGEQGHLGDSISGWQRQTDHREPARRHAPELVARRDRDRLPTRLQPDRDQGDPVRGWDRETDHRLRQLS